MNDFLQSLRNGQAEKPRNPKTRKNHDNSYHYTSSSRFNAYGNGYQNTRNQNMKRPMSQNQQGNQLPMDDTSLTSILAEAIEDLSSHIETLTKNQDHLITAQERTADMIERQAIAIERIIDHLNIAPAQPPAPGKKSTPTKTFENHYVTTKKPGKEIIEPEITESDITKSGEPLKTPVEEIKPIKKPVKPVIRKREKVVAKKAKKTIVPKTKFLGREAVMDIINSMRVEGATFDQVATRLIELKQPTFSGRGEWHAQTIHRLCNKKK